MRRKLLKIIGVLFICLFLIFAASLIYVQVNKDRILSDAVHKINERINGELLIGKQEISLFKNFPFPAVHFQDIKLRDANYKIHGFTFLEAKDVYLSLNVLKAIRGSSPVQGIRIIDASLYLYNDSTGLSNTAIFRKGKGGELPSRIELIDTRLTQDDRRKPKRHQLFANHISIEPENTSAGILLSTKLDLTIDSLSFNLAKGGYLKGHKVKGEVDLLMHGGAISFNEEILRINNQDYNLSGEFNILKKKFRLHINARSVSYNNLKNLLTPKARNALSMFNPNELQNVKAVITGTTTPGQPHVHITAEVRQQEMTTPFMDFRDASFRVQFNNRMDSSFAPHDSNSIIRLTEFNAKWRTIPVLSKGIQITNLTDPVLKCDLTSEFNLSQLDKILSSRTLSFRKGQAMVALNYDGPMKRDEATNAFINGTVSLRSGELTYRPRSIDLVNVNALLRFQNSDLFVEKLDANALGQQFYMKGYGKQLLTLIQTAPSNALLEWDIRTPFLDISKISWLLKKPENSRLSNANGISGMAAKIDDVIEKGRLNVKLSSPRIRYGEFNAGNLFADISLLSDRYVLNRVNMDHAGGLFILKGNVAASGAGHNVKLDTEMKNVDVSEVFASFNNFGQDGIVSQNLEGKLSTTAKASFMINEEGMVLPNTMSGIVNFSLIDGALLNYEPVKKIQRFIFKKRNFDNIRFAELKNNLEIINGEIKINRMEISSSVLWMYVEGLYSRKGNTDISIQIPLKNLKKRDELNPENAGLKNGGSSIYIRGRPGEDGNIKFKLDLFNRFDKSNLK